MDDFGEPTTGTKIGFWVLFLALSLPTLIVVVLGMPELFQNPLSIIGTAGLLVGWVVMLGLRRRRRRITDGIIESSNDELHREVRRTLEERFSGTWASEKGEVAASLTFGGRPMTIRFVPESTGYRFELAVDQPLEHDFAFVLSGDGDRIDREGSATARELYSERLGGRAHVGELMRASHVRALRYDDGAAVRFAGNIPVLRAETVYPLIAGASRIVDRLERGGVDKQLTAGQTCPYCRDPLVTGDRLFACAVCGTIHHRECWREHGRRCAVFGCLSVLPQPASSR
ncbi:MAG: hypothetical protein KC609_06200 [Myxococcales bacterium]|nr:hypothetical protein [Myxococcales bacterium]